MPRRAVDEQWIQAGGADEDPVALAFLQPHLRPDAG